MDHNNANGDRFLRFVVTRADVSEGSGEFVMRTSIINGSAWTGRDGKVIGIVHEIFTNDFK